MGDGALTQILNGLIGGVGGAGGGEAPAAGGGVPGVDYPIEVSPYTGNSTAPWWYSTNGPIYTPPPVDKQPSASWAG